DQRQRGERRGGDVELREDLQRVPQLLMEVLTGHRWQPEEILPLSGPDDDSDAGSEPGDHRIGNEFDDRTEARDSEQQQDHAGQQSSDLQTVDAVLSSDAGEDDDKGAGGTCYLQPATAEQRNDDTGDDRRVETLLGLRTRSDRKSHRERQSYHTDDDAGDDVTQPMRTIQQAGTACLEQRNHPETQRAN